ncbi:hypothetical protein BC567DRAFT_27013 [Phyllosticta citribraziliensis]
MMLLLPVYFAQLLLSPLPSLGAAMTSPSSSQPQEIRLAHSTTHPSAALRASAAKGQLQLVCPFFLCPRTVPPTSAVHSCRLHLVRKYPGPVRVSAQERPVRQLTHPVRRSCCLFERAATSSGGMMLCHEPLLALTCSAWGRSLENGRDGMGSRRVSRLRGFLAPPAMHCGTGVGGQDKFFQLSRNRPIWWRLPRSMQIPWIDGFSNMSSPLSNYGRRSASCWDLRCCSSTCLGSSVPSSLLPLLNPLIIEWLPCGALF